MLWIRNYLTNNPAARHKDLLRSLQPRIYYYYKAVKKQYMKEKVSAGLGVKCDVCHVFGADGPDFAADDKPEKATARRMITMVMELNATRFDGKERISCVTCHRGQRKPVSADQTP